MESSADGTIPPTTEVDDAGGSPALSGANLTAPSTDQEEDPPPPLAVVESSSPSHPHEPANESNDSNPSPVGESTPAAKPEEEALTVSEEFAVPESIESTLSKLDDSDKNEDSARSGDSDRNDSADEYLSDNTTDSSSGSQKGRRSNRCQVCRKKVGLTGFTCRCGGLFCSLHRYSDKHNCSFNYRELGAEEIRKNNPVISGEKIHKI